MVDQESIIENDDNTQSSQEGEVHDSSKGESKPDELLSKRPRQASVVTRQKLKRWLNPTDDLAALGNVVIPIVMTSFFNLNDVKKKI